jgi:hypothetical protein
MPAISAVRGFVMSRLPAGLEPPTPQRSGGVGGGPQARPAGRRDRPAPAGRLNPYRYFSQNPPRTSTPTSVRLRLTLLWLVKASSGLQAGHPTTGRPALHRRPRTSDPRSSLVQALERLACVSRVAGRRHVPLPAALLRHRADYRESRRHRCAERTTALEPADHPGDLRALVAEEGPPPQRRRVRTARRRPPQKVRRNLSRP